MSGRADTELANGLFQGLKEEAMEEMTREDRTEWGQELQVPDGRETPAVPLHVQHWALGIVLGKKRETQGYCRTRSRREFSHSAVRDLQCLGRHPGRRGNTENK